MKQSLWATTLLALFSGGLLAPLPLLGWQLPAPQPTSQPLQQPTSQPQMTPLVLATQLVVAGEIVADAAVFIEAVASNGEAQALQTQSDDQGRIHVDLGMRQSGEQFMVSVVRGERRYYSPPLLAGAALGSTLLLYPAAVDRSKISETAMRIVLRRGEENPGIVVHQIVMPRNRGEEVFFGTQVGEGRYDTAFWFPVPEGATVTQLSVGTRAVDDLTVREHPDYGWGVPVEHALYPVEGGNVVDINGSFELSLAPGAVFDIGYTPANYTDKLVLALETGKFRYIGNEGVGAALIPRGVMPVPNVQQTLGWIGEEFPAKGRLVAKVAMEDVELSQVPVTLFTQLLNGTQLWLESHGGQRKVEPRPLRQATVTIRSVTEGSVLGSVQSGLQGEVSHYLGERSPQEEIVVEAWVDDKRYRSPKLSLQRGIPQSMFLFEASADGAALQQTVTRIVTENVDMVGGKKSVHVRQILQLRNSAASSYFGPQTRDGFGAAVVFPVPRGAVLQELMVNGQSQLDTEAAEHPEWGGLYGVAVDQPLFPHEQGVFLMGTYLLDVEEGSEIDFGYRLPIRTLNFTLALENRRFSYLADQTVLQSKGPITPQGVTKMVNGWIGENLAMGTVIAAPVRFADPGLDSETVGWILVWLGGGGVAIAIGMMLSRQDQHRRQAQESEFLADVEDRVGSALS